MSSARRKRVGGSESASLEIFLSRLPPRAPKGSRGFFLPSTLGHRCGHGSATATGMGKSEVGRALTIGVADHRLDAVVQHHDAGRHAARRTPGSVIAGGRRHGRDRRVRRALLRLRIDPRRQDAGVAGGRRRARRSGAGVSLGGAADGGGARRGHDPGRPADRAALVAPVGDAAGGRSDPSVLHDPQPGGAAGARRRGAARDALRRGRRALADGGDDHRQPGEHRARLPVRVRATPRRGGSAARAVGARPAPREST
jgi:hypothetical protein